MHRLRDVVQGPQLQTLDRRVHLGHAGQHDDGHVRIAQQGLTEEGDPIHLGHVDVRNADRDLPHPPQDRQGVGPGGGLDRGQPMRRGDAHEHLPHLRVIVDDETACGCAVGRE